MASYLLHFIHDEIQPKEAYHIAEADSAQQVVEQMTAVFDAVVEVWTLRSGEPRIFEVTTESVRTVKRVE